MKPFTLRRPKKGKTDTSPVNSGGLEQRAKRVNPGAYAHVRYPTHDYYGINWDDWAIVRDGVIKDIALQCRLASRWTEVTMYHEGCGLAHGMVSIDVKWFFDGKKLAYMRVRYDGTPYDLRYRHYTGGTHDEQRGDKARNRTHTLRDGQ